MALDAPWARVVATSGDAAIWLVDLDAAEPVLAVLSEDERARADRFVFDVHRRRFIAGRAWLRQQLGRHLGRAPADLRFEYGPAGKPALADGTLRFNLSHSERFALAAIADREVGVDIERHRELRDMDALAERVFSPAERDALARVAPARKVDAFFAGWTRKEAYIKARGEGIALLGSIEVSLDPGDSPRLIRVEGQPDEPQRWSIEAFSPVPGYAAAVCLEGAGRRWIAV